MGSSRLLSIAWDAIAEPTVNRQRWNGCHRRSLAETAMSRLERLGERLSACGPARQVTEVQIASIRRGPRRAAPVRFDPFLTREQFADARDIGGP